MNHYTFDELQVGKRDAIETMLRDEDMLRFVELSGDVSPIHVDEGHARSKGFKAKVAHGALLTAYVSRFIGVHLPGANGLLQTLEMQFRRPCYPGTMLRIEGEVARRTEAVRTIRITITITDANEGTVLATGTVQAGVLSGPN